MRRPGNGKKVMRRRLWVALAILTSFMLMATVMVIQAPIASNPPAESNSSSLPPEYVDACSYPPPPPGVDKSKYVALRKAWVRYSTSNGTALYLTWASTCVPAGDVETTEIPPRGVRPGEGLVDVTGHPNLPELFADSQAGVLGKMWYVDLASQQVKRK